MDKDKLEQGHYWVKFFSQKWSVAKYVGNDKWLDTGDSKLLDGDFAIEEIGEPIPDNDHLKNENVKESLQQVDTMYDREWSNQTQGKQDLNPNWES